MSDAANDRKNPAAAKKARLGIILFFVYLAIYSGFIVINTVRSKLMANRIFMGLNLAVVYGMGLIVLAIIMGLIYNRLCNRIEKACPEDRE